MNHLTTEELTRMVQSHFGMDDEVINDILEQVHGWLGDNQQVAVYRNEDLGHPEVGRIQLMRTGEGCTFQDPPRNAPDSEECGFGWRYVLYGVCP